MSIFDFFSYSVFLILSVLICVLSVFGVITEFEAAQLQEHLESYEFMIAFGNDTCLLKMPEKQQLGSQLCVGFGQPQQVKICGQRPWICHLQTVHWSIMDTTIEY